MEHLRQTVAEWNLHKKRKALAAYRLHLIKSGRSGFPLAVIPAAEISAFLSASRAAHLMSSLSDEELIEMTGIAADFISPVAPKPDKVEKEKKPGPSKGRKKVPQHPAILDLIPRYGQNTIVSELPGEAWEDGGPLEKALEESGKNLDAQNAAIALENLGRMRNTVSELVVFLLPVGATIEAPQEEPEAPTIMPATTIENPPGDSPPFKSATPAAPSGARDTVLDKGTGEVFKLNPPMKPLPAVGDPVASPDDDLPEGSNHEVDEDEYPDGTEEEPVHATPIPVDPPKPKAQERKVKPAPVLTASIHEKLDALMDAIAEGVPASCHGGDRVLPEDHEALQMQVQDLYNFIHEGGLEGKIREVLKASFKP